MARLTKKQKEENVERSTRGGAALDAYRDQYDNGEPDNDVLSDLLADLMHYAAGEKLDFHERLATAQMHYNAEKNGED